MFAKVEEEVVRVVKSVTLTMTEKEAGDLLRICGNVGGYEKGTPRETATKICDALEGKVKPASLFPTQVMYFPHLRENQ